MELTGRDLAIVQAVFPKLQEIASLDAIGTVTILIGIDGQTFTIGYGESAEPAILGVRDD